jgi:hypothetical protein
VDTVRTHYNILGPDARGVDMGDAGDISGKRVHSFLSRLAIMLYLASFTLVETRYMGETTRKEVVRLVDAANEEDARLKVEAAYHSSLYGVYRDIYGLDCSPVIS